MLENIKQEVKNILSGAGVDVEIKLETPPGSDKGDLAFPCFEYAKRLGENPSVVAKDLADLADGVEGEGIFEKVQAKGPYVNFFVNLSDIADDVLPAIIQQQEEYGFKDRADGAKILIEYPSPNTHKRFHVGHLRNVCIGNALVKLYSKNGYEVSVVNYVNDLGVHVAKSIWAILNFYNGEIPDKNLHKWLGKVYTKASKELQDNPERKEEVEEVLKKISSGDGKIREIFQKTRDASIVAFEKIFKELNTEHEKIYFESDLRERGQEIVDELLQEGIAQRGEGGAIIVDLSDEDLNVALLRKSNGEGLYITSDFALAEQKQKDYPGAEESIYITATEQNLHFKQLFRILNKAGYEKELTHIGYGLVNLPEGKMSSREGNIVLYTDLKQRIFEKLKQETKNRNQGWSQKKIEKLAKKLTLAVSKFELQKHQAHKNITFDLDQATDFEGYSAPYVLYVIARINSLKKNSDVYVGGKVDFDKYRKKEERKLIMKLSEFEEVIEEALENYNTSKITRYCFDLAQLFNDYYSKHSIINENNEDLTRARLTLSMCVKQVLENACEVLTIDTVDQM